MDVPEKFVVTTSPHISSPDSTARVMWSVSICLIPAGIWGVVMFGFSALLTMLCSIGAALLTEWGISKLTGKFTLNDGSAFLTGLLVGFNLPPQIPLYIPVFASIFAIAVVKWTFGGLGANWMNPALAGRVFAFFSWSGLMNRWKTPGVMMEQVDAVTMATPLGSIKAGLLADGVTEGITGPTAFLQNLHFPVSDNAVSIAGFFEQTFGWSTNGYYWDLLFGWIPGSIGEMSALLLILGAVYLLIRKIITPAIPLSYAVSFSLLVWIFGGMRYNAGYFHGDILFNLLSGGLVLGALYMATDMATTPLSRKGMIIFGVGCGFLTFLIRFFGSFPEGVSLAIIVMNVFVPLINKLTKPKKFGLEKKNG